MKVIYEKIYLLSKEEEEAMNMFLRTLTYDPCPCDKCNAKLSGKCSSHDIFDAIDKKEICNIYKKWAEKSSIEIVKNKISNLQNEEIKNIIRKEYDYICLKNEQEKSQTNLLIAENRKNKAISIPKYRKDFSYKTDNLWEEEEEDSVKLSREKKEETNA